MDAIDGDSPFFMHTDGKGWLFAPSGIKDGPLPTHYEPIESPVDNPLYGQRSNPTAKVTESPLNPIAPPADAEYPVVATTYRLTEHYLSGGMSRFDSWLNELQPAMFVEIEHRASAGARYRAWRLGDCEQPKRRDRSTSDGNAAPAQTQDRGQYGPPDRACRSTSAIQERSRAARPTS